MTLRVESLTKEFGDIIAVDDVDWTLEDGETRAIIGPNGAGKSTFFNLISGVFPPTSGSIFFQDANITGDPPHKIADIGIVKTYQITNIFDELSVAENIKIAAQAPLMTFDILSDREEIEAVNGTTERVLDRLGMTHQKDERAGTLSYGDQRKLELGIALATEPEILLLDEPTAGMSTEETKNMLDLLHEVSQQYTIVVTEHDIDFILDLAEHITVFHDGSILSDGSPNAITEDQKVQRVYLGRS